MTGASDDKKNKGEKAPPRESAAISLSAPLLLIASPQLLDPNFKQTVVLIAEHTSAGALGFVINRPNTLSVRDLLNNQDIDIPPEVPAWAGGPVDLKTAIVLTNQSAKAGDNEIAPGVVLSSTGSSLELMAQQARDRLAFMKQGNTIPTTEKLYPFRFVMGYAGWGEGQLDDEIVSGGWLTVPLDLQLLFNTPWPKMWESALARLHINHGDFVAPVHQYLN